MDYVPYGRQSIDENDIKAVVDVLRSDFLTQGPAVERFEEAVGDVADAAHCVAVNSATSALHIACLALEVGAGDWVWTSPNSFVASANCALYCGARVDFVDIDPATFNMCPQALVRKLEQAEAAGRLPKVVIPVHLCGQPCRMDEIGALAKRYGFKIIEDASHAIGGQYQGRPIGACDYSDITVFSFHPVKIVTTGEGGCATTQNEQLAERMRLLRSHGITRDERKMTEPSHGPWYYQQIDLGMNYRMTELQAALGKSQMTRLESFVARRHVLASRYDDGLRSLPLDLPFRHADAYSGFHLYVIQLRLDQIRHTHREVFDELRQKRIGVNLHYIPIYLQPFYRQMGFDPGYCPEAERYYSRSISIPLYHDMTELQQDRVMNVIEQALR
ncbi:UDP-4-amino-4,6-dideoxy-N-acetyl-beta-L-altrosamine transaminase [Rhizorhapis suberifaciens]|uniref:UDP-4-amino-4, 6-dideoxy-N-acetyl-beta-L-altrosamine transaminase n=1 Tax=Rhizorhapis suberifaciens TaxID=13656 RepID=A0A840HQU4_9SPHN|nr:UDP-4-amino-4,6-dideoxy-N-acetyl-beta-L-altrosamine transaminase [Rhizorhapis suberifaciens]MBB4640081.1 UDP-4-amino-4,6-dideoxy-N-acetyl-beta-L-altrosamine transaminase [Rhizorhapis suberifaciens]